ncbi:circadian clock-controlled protein daywake-like [Metopolophium dirhodum]|uniref:circadian clock-controlled protein daywake-like n=1 Tax=Metopolophium dirhodum TaxID=44670 RepID=UPI002990142E|nr:circadian clock-controlled protein daywake-like [Metopolophium dirhodum]
MGGQMFLLIASIVLIAQQTQHTTAKRLPNFVHVCKRSDPQIEKCLLQTIESLRPELPNGIPKMQIPALEPMVIPMLVVNRNEDALKVKATIKDVQAWGGSKFVINNLKINFEKLNGEGTVLLPNLFVNCTYDIDGRLMVVPLQGQGIFRGNITNTKADVKASLEVLKDKKNREYFQVKDIRIKLKVGDANGKIIPQNINKNNDVLTETASTFYHQNRRVVLDIITPIAEEIAVEFSLQIANTILKTILYDEILPKELP